MLIVLLTSVGLLNATEHSWNGKYSENIITSATVHEAIQSHNTVYQASSAGFGSRVPRVGGGHEPPCAGHSRFQTALNRPPEPQPIRGAHGPPLRAVEGRECHWAWEAQPGGWEDTRVRRHKWRCVRGHTGEQRKGDTWRKT